jgi:hypothetical protein
MEAALPLAGRSLLRYAPARDELQGRLRKKSKSKRIFAY